MYLTHLDRFLLNLDHDLISCLVCLVPMLQRGNADPVALAANFYRYLRTIETELIQINISSKIETRVNISFVD